MGLLGNTFLVLLGKSWLELDEYNPKDLVSFPDFLLFLLLWHCHCLLPAWPSKNPNNPTFLHLYIHNLLLLPFSEWHFRKKKRRDVPLWHCLRLRRRNKHDLLVNGNTVYSKMWFILFKRVKYFAADFPSSHLLGPNSVLMFQVIVWTKHRASLPGITGIGYLIQKEISGETIRELAENYLPLVILLFVETADLLKWFFLQNDICCEETRISNKFSETERRTEKEIERMKCLGPQGSCQT